jgi:hypothetical protein
MQECCNVFKLSFKRPEFGHIQKACIRAHTKDLYSGTYKRPVFGHIQKTCIRAHTKSLRGKFSLYTTEINLTRVNSCSSDRTGKQCASIRQSFGECRVGETAFFFFFFVVWKICRSCSFLLWRYV